MNFKYEIKKYPSKSSFDMIYELNRLGNESNCFKRLVRISSTLMQDLEMIVGRENVESEIIRFMDDYNIPKSVQNQFLNYGFCDNRRILGENQRIKKER